jgi:hypothetical protein
MATFTDAEGRDWTITIDAPTILAIREDCDPQFLLHDDGEQNTYTRLVADPVLLCRVVFLLCAKERKERAITEADFYASVIGDAIDGAVEAVLAAIVNFTPRRRRAILEAVAAKSNTLQDMATARALTKLADPAVAKAAEDMIERELAAAMASFTTRPPNATP